MPEAITKTRNDDPQAAVKRLAFVLVLAALFVVVSTRADATPQSSDQAITVGAFNRGVLDCSCSAPHFSFGPVDADGRDFGTPGVAAAGRNGNGSGGLYASATAAITWTCRSAPPRVIDVTLESTPLNHQGGMTADALRVEIPGNPGGGTSQPGRSFTSKGSSLVTGMRVGNAAAALSGEVRFTLSVGDTDPMGPNTWTVLLMASAFGAPAGSAAPVQFPLCQVQLASY